MRFTKKEPNGFSFRPGVYLLLLPLLWIGCRRHEPAAATDLNAAQLAEEMEFYLCKNLLDFYYPGIIDADSGGYITNLAFDGTPKPPHPKMIVSQARHLWTACKAAERYPQDARFRQAADHGFRYLRERMWDRQHGGFYFYLDLPWTDHSLSGYKKAYGEAFAIFALAAYVKLTGSADALALAQQAFVWFDDHCHDAHHGGYYEWITLDGISRAGAGFRRDLFPADAVNAEWKDYNSSIHILEAFAELYAVWPDPLLRKRLEEMLVIIRDTITTEKGYMRLFFTSDWTAISYRDSSRAFLMKNLSYDHVSFGHDIETAYLLLEAEHTLGAGHDGKTRLVAKKMIDHTLDHGFDKNFSGIVDAGYYYSENAPITILRNDKVWWCQAEGLNALLLFAKLHPEEKRYRQAFLLLWDYVKTYFIDHRYGDWYIHGVDQNPAYRTERKAEAWKTAYHNGRSLMNAADLLLGKGALHSLIH